MNKFYFVYSDILNSIKSGDYPVDSYLPGEHQLRELYQVSRQTVRKALQILEEEGYILKEQRKGARVLAIPGERRDGVSAGLLSFKEMTKNRSDTFTKILSIESAIVPSDLILKGKEPKGFPAYKIVRVRYRSDKASIVDIDYINRGIVKKITEDDIKESLYDFLENDLDLEISYGNKEIVIVPADKYVSEILSIPKGEKVVRILQNVFLGDSQFLQVSLSYHKTEDFRFTEFTRRKVSTY